MMAFILPLLEGLLYVIFALSALLLIVVVLLQESKGGGMGEAFGGMGAETFGVRASGITKFTGYVAGAFLLSALLIPITGKVQRSENTDRRFGANQGAPETPGENTNNDDGAQNNDSVPAKKEEGSSEGDPENNSGDDKKE